MTKKHTPVSVAQIIDAYGSVYEMVDTLGADKITRQAIQKWKAVPPHWVLIIESHTGYSRHQIRPDIYGSKPVAPEPLEPPKKSKAA